MTLHIGFRKCLSNDGMENGGLSKLIERAIASFFLGYVSAYHDFASRSLGELLSLSLFLFVPVLAVLQSLPLPPFLSFSSTTYLHTVAGVQLSINRYFYTNRDRRVITFLYTFLSFSFSFTQFKLQSPMSDKYLQSDKQRLLNAIGTEVCWGWSPAVDFVELLRVRDQEIALLSSSKPPALTSTLPSCAPSKTELQNSPADTAAIDPVKVDFPGESTAAEKAEKKSATVKEKVYRDASDLDALIEQLHLKKEEKRPATSSSAAIADDGVHILLAGGSDIRHILKTMSARRAAEAKQEASGAAGDDGPMYHFYLYEPNLRLHCRHLFFLQWLLDSFFSLEELEERVLMFLEVYGNTLLRDRTAAQLRLVVQRLKKSFESGEGELLQIVSFDEMKLKERDFIESQLRHWCSDTSHADLEGQWAYRLRQEMAERFDNRDNIIDWDFVFHLTDYTNLLKFPEYRTWRNTGIAFDACHINPRRGFDYNYTIPNKSLCFFDRHGRGSYQGDVKNGPFFGLGAQTANQLICQRTTDGTCKYGNGVVSMHNCRAWLYTCMTGLPWPWADHQFAWDDPKHYNYLPPGTPSGVSYQAKFPRVQFHFVGLDFDRFLLHCRDGKVPRMDAAFFGTSCVHLMTSDCLETMMDKSHGVVVAETVKFVVDAEDPTKEAFQNKLDAAARSGGWRRDDNLTSLLHKGQPASKPMDANPSAAQKLTSGRYSMPYHIAFVPQTS